MNPDPDPAPVVKQPAQPARRLNVAGEKDERQWERWGFIWPMSPVKAMAAGLIPVMGTTGLRMEAAGVPIFDEKAIRRPVKLRGVRVTDVVARIALPLPIPETNGCSLAPSPPRNVSGQRSAFRA